MLGRQFPSVGDMLREAEPELLAFAVFPVPHWKRIWSTNPLERLNKEIKSPPTWSRCSPTPPPCCAWPAPSSSKAHDE